MLRFLQKHVCYITKSRSLLAVLLFALTSTLLFVNKAAALPVHNIGLANGILKGVVVDSLTKEALIGVTISVKGIGKGASSDIEGKYSIRDIPEGTYEVSISYIGYQTATIGNVKIEAGQTTTLNYEMVSASTELEAFEIIGDKALSGKVIETNNLSLVNAIKASSLITTGISAQQIARSADQDAGEVASRLPGVTVVSNFVNIRGMQDRYNITILNGMVAPSSEADRRAFSFDLLPSNMIDKMTVYRSPAPELLADWAGGVIKIETKNTSIARQIEVNMSTSYRSNSSLKDLSTYKGGKKDWMGKDDGTRALAADFPAVGDIPGGGLTNNSVPLKPIETFTDEELAANAKWGRSLFSNYDLEKKSSALDYRAGINYYESRRIGNVRFSNLTSINTTQSNTIQYQDFTPEKNPSITIEGKPDNGAATIYNDTINQQVSRWGLLQNFAFTFNPKHSVQFNGLFNQLGMDEVYVRNGFDLRGETGLSGPSTKLIYTYRSRTLLALQASGKHAFGSDEEYSHKISWTAAFNSSREETPAQRTLVFRPTALSTDATDPRFLNGVDVDFNANHSLFYSKTKEDNTLFSLDYEKKLKIGSTLKIGFFNENKFKPLTSRLIRTGVLNPDSVDQYHLDEAFKGAETYKDDGTGSRISDDGDLSGQFEATGKIYAGYAAVNLPLFNDKLKVYGGVRYEGQDLLLVVPPSRYLEITGRKSELINRYISYWLPSINVTYNINKKTALRAAYGQTINRPNYRELITLLVFDPRLENARIGNDSLKDAQIHNFDLRLEFYPSDGEFISAGAFYKNLINAIEPYVQQVGLGEQIKFENSKSAVVMGVEVEVRKTFSFLPWAWGKNLSTIANVAILKSEVQLKDSLFNNQGASGSFTDNRTAGRPLEGTANFVVNAGIYYDYEKWGTKVAAIYNIVGQRLVTAGTTRYPDTYELPRHSLDLTLRQKITKFMELRLSVQDVLNQSRRLYRDYDRDQVYNPTKRNKLVNNDWMYQEYKPGSYFTLGINVKL